MLKISRESEINLVNVLIDNDIISGKDLINIKKVSSENNKSQIESIFELKLTDEEKIINLLIKEQNLETIDLKKVEITDDVKTVLPSNYIKVNFVILFEGWYYICCALFKYFTHHIFFSRINISHNRIVNCIYK